MCYILTHLCLIDFSISINLTSSFPILGLLGGIFHFHSNLKRTFGANSGDPDQRPHYLASDLGLRCLPMFHKKDAKLIWVNRYLNENNILFSCMRVPGWIQIRPDIFNGHDLDPNCLQRLSSYIWPYHNIYMDC